MNRYILVLGIALISGITLGAGSAASGEKIYKSKCVECHGETGMGLKERQAPMLAGQFDWYIILQLEAFRNGERNNPDMLPFIKNLSKKDFEDLAAYISSLRSTH